MRTFAYFSGVRAFAPAIADASALADRWSAGTENSFRRSHPREILAWDGRRPLFTMSKS